jgi:hypothetical protein
VFVAATLPAAFTLDPKYDHDTWWHLRVGQLVDVNQSIPVADPFSRMGQEHPTQWVAYSWLYEWALYKTHATFDSLGILWARTILAALSTAAVFALLPSRGWQILPAAILAGITMMPLMKERPWHITIIFTAITAGTIASVRGGSSVSRSRWLVLIFAIWANCHVQFVMGWIILALACVFPGRAGRQSLVILTAGCVVATLCNPYFWRLHVVVLEYATQTGPLRVVQELAPPDLSSPWLWSGLVLLVWSSFIAVRRRPIDWFEVVLIVVALFFLLRMRRDVWFATVASGVVLRPIDSNTITSLSRWAVASVVVAAFVVVRAINLAGLGPPHDTSAANEHTYPVQAVAFVRERELPGPLFNSFDWGGYLIWALPTHPVSIDGRTNLYGSERVTRSMNTWTGKPGWDNDPELTSAKLVIAPSELPLTTLLRERPAEWQLAYENQSTVVFVAIGR